MHKAKIIHLNSVNSTNDYVKNNISKLENLSFVYADRQTSGRGRLDRKWIDTNEDNLFLTIAIKPFANLNQIYSNFTQYLAVILSLVLEEDYGLSPQIKWPNDVLVNGKKIAGILAEGTTIGGKFQGLALGVGVNLNTKIENLKKIDKPATSILNETGKYIDKTTFLEKLSTKFCLMYDSYIEGGFPTIKNLYTKKAIFLGNEIEVNVLGTIHKGVAENITDDGSLVLNEGLKTNIYYIGDIL